MLLTAVHLIALFLLLGPPLSYLAAWQRILPGEDHTDALLRGCRQLALGGLGLYIISGLGLVIQDAVQGPAGSWTAALLKLIMALLYVIFLQRATVPGTERTYLWATAATAAALLVAHAAAAETGVGSPLPLLADAIHLGAAAAWGGSLTWLAGIGWSGRGSGVMSLGRDFWRIAHRHGNIGIVSLILIILAGIVLKTVHVHGTAAMTYTTYGQILGLKIIISTVLAGLFVIELAWIGPALKRYGGDADEISYTAAFKRYRWLLTLEALAIAALVAVTASLARLEPPATAPFLNPQSWTMQVDGAQVRVEMQPVAGNPAEARLEIFLPDIEPYTGGAEVRFDLSLSGRGMGFENVEALQASPVSYLGETAFPVPGQWRFGLSIAPHGGGAVSGTREIDIPAQPLVDDISTYFSLHAIAYQPATWITFLVGVALIAVYGWLAWRSRQGRIPRWMTLAGLCGVGFGFYLALGVSLVKTYPSTFWKNPAPYTAGVIERGRAAYVAECAECHGDAGTGDGPWARTHRGGSIPDLSAPHMDVHTDGEIYWWITHGIPSLDMPPLAAELDLDDRWAVVNYVRSLRHGVP